MTHRRSKFFRWIAALGLAQFQPAFGATIISLYSNSSYVSVASSQKKTATLPAGMGLEISQSLEQSWALTTRADNSIGSNSSSTLQNVFLGLTTYLSGSFSNTVAHPLVSVESAQVNNITLDVGGTYTKFNFKKGDGIETNYTSDTATGTSSGVEAGLGVDTLIGDTTRVGSKVTASFPLSGTTKITRVNLQLRLMFEL